MQQSFKHIFISMIPVVLGILVALFINNWQENLRNQKFIDRAITSIEQELKENQADLNETLPKHLALIDSISHHMENENISPLEIIQQMNGLQIIFIKSSTWKFFLNTKVELIDYEVVSRLVAIEESKKLYDLKFNKFMDFLYKDANKPDREYKMQFLIQFSNVIDSEQSLLRLHEKYFELDSD